MSVIYYRIVGEYGRPITDRFANRSNDLAAALPEGSTITVTGTRVDTGVVIFTDREVTITDWATLAFSVTFQSPDLDAACSIRLRFKAIPLNGTQPIDIPENDKVDGVYLVVGAF